MAELTPRARVNLKLSEKRGAPLDVLFFLDAANLFTGILNLRPSWAHGRLGGLYTYPMGGAKRLFNPLRKLTRDTYGTFVRPVRQAQRSSLPAVADLQEDIESLLAAKADQLTPETAAHLEGLLYWLGEWREGVPEFDAFILWNEAVLSRKPNRWEPAALEGYKPDMKTLRARISDAVYQVAKNGKHGWKSGTQSLWLDMRRRSEEKDIQATMDRLLEVPGGVVAEEVPDAESLKPRLDPRSPRRIFLELVERVRTWTPKALLHGTGPEEEISLEGFRAEDEDGEAGPGEEIFAQPPGATPIGRAQDVAVKVLQYQQDIALWLAWQNLSPEEQELIRWTGRHRPTPMSTAERQSATRARKKFRRTAKGLLSTQEKLDWRQFSDFHDPDTEEVWRLESNRRVPQKPDPAKRGRSKDLENAPTPEEPGRVRTVATLMGGARKGST